jgi:hypothetical protein
MDEGGICVVTYYFPGGYCKTLIAFRTLGIYYRGDDEPGWNDVRRRNRDQQRRVMTEEAFTHLMCGPRGRRANLEHLLQGTAARDESARIIMKQATIAITLPFPARHGRLYRDA